MECTVARGAISAALDGEWPAVDTAELDAHLAGCAACRAWREAAHETTRRVRLTAAQPAPSAGAALLAAVARADREGVRLRPGVLSRLALVAVALGQIAVTVPALIFGSDRGAPIHVAHEMGSFDMALAVGFLVAAWRPARAQGMRPLVGAAALLLVVTATIDLLAGRTSAGDEAPHLLAVAGWLLLDRLAAVTPSGVGGQAGSIVGWSLRRLGGMVRLRPSADVQTQPREGRHAVPTPGSAATRAALWGCPGQPLEDGLLADVEVSHARLADGQDLR